MRHCLSCCLLSLLAAPLLVSSTRRLFALVMDCEYDFLDDCDDSYSSPVAVRQPAVTLDLGAKGTKQKGAGVGSTSSLFKLGAAKASEKKSSREEKITSEDEEDEVVPAASDEEEDDDEGENETSSSGSSGGFDRAMLAHYSYRPSPVTIPRNSIRLTYLHSFLRDYECLTLLSLAEGEFERSQTTVGISPNRTSYSAELPQMNTTVRSIRKRVACLCAVSQGCVEELSVVRYEPGQQFTPHHDSDLSGDLKPRRFTLFAYLNQVIGGGGETEFTKLNIKFKPKRGDALLWENHATKTSPHHEDGEHAGRPPVSGVKYGECSSLSAVT